MSAGSVIPGGQRWVRTAAYTLSEIVVVIAIMGVLALIAVPVYSGIRQSSLQTAAMHEARLINAARDSYALTVPDAATAWAAAATDDARLNLLISENLLSGSRSDYTDMPGDYAVQLSGGLRTRTVLTQGGHEIDY